MPIDIEWHVPSRILYIRISGHVKPDELRAFPNRARKHLPDAIKSLHVLLDDADAAPPIFTVSQFHRLLDVKSDHADMIGWVVAFGKTSLLASLLLPMLMRMIGVQYTRVGTLQEAISFLCEQDDSLQFILKHV